MNAQPPTSSDLQDRKALFRSQGLSLSAEVDKTLIALSTAIFGGAAAFLSAHPTNSWAASCFLLTLLLSALAAAGFIADMSASARLLIGWAAAIAGEDIDAGVFGPPDRPPEERLKRFQRRLADNFANSMKCLFFAVSFGGIGIVLQCWDAVWGGAKVWATWLCIAIVGVLIFAMGLSYGRRIERRRVSSTPEPSDRASPNKDIKESHVG